MNSFKDYADRVVLHVHRRQSTYGFFTVLLVAAIAVALTTQGWRSRIPAFDLLTYIHSVHDLVGTGALPEHGDTGSYGSFKPPGTAWLMLPSTVLFEDPRLSEYAGTAFLHFAALLGLYLLARKYFGTWCACLAVVLYGLSSIGLFLAGSLWPNGRPDFFIWMVYLASEWVTRRDARYLAASVGVWGVGMHVDMALAPALLILPTLWFVYRAPVGVKPLLVVAALLLVVWAPYLSFEAPRRFVDIRSQVLLKAIHPRNYTDSWCNPSLRIRQLAPVNGAAAGEELPLPNAAVTYSLPARVESVADKFLSNFSVRVPGASGVLLLVVIATLVLVNVSGASPKPNEARTRRPDRSGWLARVAIASVLGGLLAHQVVIPPLLDLGGVVASLASPVATLSKVLVLGGGALLAGGWAARQADRLLARAGVQFQTRALVERRRALVLALAVPWLTVVAVAEPGKPERFLWLWPLQVLFLAAFVSDVLPRLRAPRLALWIAPAVLLFLLVGNSFLRARVDAWGEEGWSGREAPEVQVVDYLADQVGERDRTSIGYHIFIYSFMATYNIINPQYKVGADFDVLLRYRHGITNTNTCAEGLSPADQFRVVRTRPKEEAWQPREYFDVPRDDRFRLVRQFGVYQVFKRY